MKISLAERIQRWLDNGGREIVQQAMRRAVQKTAERNKARQLPPDFLDRRFTI